MAKIRTYLIDDHNVVRQAVAAMLEGTDVIEVVGQNGDPIAGLAEVAVLKPKVVLIDLKMPGLSGLAAIPEIMKIDPGIRVAVFTMYDNPAYVWGAINAGASCYLLKTATREELIRAISAVAVGSGYLQAEVTMPLLKRFSHEARTLETRQSLSLRELQILECLADGLGNKEIATRLSLSEETIKTHLSNIYEKLDASDRAHAVAIALRQRMIE
jgi:DNA-binding NarL/FixJ family response regulator